MKSLPPQGIAKLDADRSDGYDVEQKAGDAAFQAEYFELMEEDDGAHQFWHSVKLRHTSAAGSSPLLLIALISCKA